MDARGYRLLLPLVALGCGSEPTPAATGRAATSAVETGSPDTETSAPPPPTEPTDGADAGKSTDECGAFPPAADLAAAGPFAIEGADEGPDCTVVRPVKLGDNGLRHPVIVWANGTSAPTTLYRGALDHWASHGFIVTAANAINGQGSGAPSIACLDYVNEKGATPGNKLFGKVCPRAGATGHSQGGGGALMAGRDPRIRVTAPLQPFTQAGLGGFDQSSISAQRGPMLLLSGTFDNNAVPMIHQQPVFDGTNVPVLWAQLVGGDHYTVALGVAAYRPIMLAWFRLHLMADLAQRPLFYGPSCGLCTDGKWTVARKAMD